MIPNVFRQQFQRAIDYGWLPVFQREARRINETTAHLLAIGSRETNLKNIKGDYRSGVAHGFGIMQVDKGTDAHFAATWSAVNFEPGIVRGCDIYAQKREQVLKGQGRQLSVRNSRDGRSYSFAGRAVASDDLRRIATAAYNCGLWAYYCFSKNKHIDSFTTGGDYGRDVYARAVIFAQLLEGVQLEPGAFKQEVERQGKYALDSDQRAAGLPVTGDEPEMTPRAVAEASKPTPLSIPPFPLYVPELKQSKAKPVALSTAKYTAPAVAAVAALTWWEWLWLNWWGVSVGITFAIALISAVGWWREVRENRRSRV